MSSELQPQVVATAGHVDHGKSALILRLTDAAVEVTGAPRETVRVILQEVPPAHWGVGGVSKAATTKEAKNG